VNNVITITTIIMITVIHRPFVYVTTCFAVADVVKKALDMTVWGLVRTLPSAESRCSSVDEYR